MDFIYLAVTIDGYDREKIARLKRVESERKVVIDHPVKSELEVLNGLKRKEKKFIFSIEKVNFRLRAK